MTIAFLIRVIIVATGAGIHRRQQHKVSGKIDRRPRTTDGNLSVFHWLPHHLQHRSAEFRQLIQEQDAVVSQRDLTRLWYTTATYERIAGDGMVGTSKGPPGNQSTMVRQLSGYALDLGRLQRLREAQWR